MLQRGVGAVVGTIKAFRIFFLNLISFRSVRRLYTVTTASLPLRSPTNPFFIPLHRRH